jgi:hypothetical protein
MESLLSHQQFILDIHTASFRTVDAKLFMTKLQSLIVSLRKTIMSSTSSSVQQAHFHLLKQLYKYIVYTRDIYGGLGERELSYQMLFIWNYHFPIPTAKCIHDMVLPIEKNPPYGSWRDIKSICLCIRSFSDKKENDPFLDTCIGIMNHYLHLDSQKWADALDLFNSKFGTPWEIPRPSPADYDISLVARWIPRESSSFGWLFDKCALQWIRSFRAHYLHSSANHPEQFQKALRKGKKEYRQIISRLSKAWDTVQIRQCAHQWDSIDPLSIPMNAMMSQQQSLLNIDRRGDPRSKTMHSRDRNTCAAKIQAAWLTHKSKNHVFVDMGFFMKQFSRVSHPLELKRLESLWSTVLSQISPFSNFIPLLDTSLFSTHVDLFHVFLSMAIAIASKSTVFESNKRLLCFDSTVHFVSLSDSDSSDSSFQSMIDIVKPIYHQHHIGSDLIRACSFIIHAIEESKLSDDCISNLVFVLFSAYSVEKYTLMKDHFLLAGLACPTFIWFPTDVSSFSSSDGPIPIIGHSNHILSQLSYVPSKDWHSITPYSFFSSLVQNPRYDPVDKYFSTILTPQPSPKK